MARICDVLGTRVACGEYRGRDSTKKTAERVGGKWEREVRWVVG